MKKVFIIATVLCTALVACNKNSQSIDIEAPQGEMSITSVNRTTKGYAVDAVFADTPFDHLHDDPAYDPADNDNYRTMQVSAYLTPQDGEESIYFTNKTFARNAGTPAPSDGYWHADPKVYWPIGGSLNLLAYSVLDPFATASVEWDSENPSSQIEFNVPSSKTQDDILFAACKDAKSTSGASPISMEFKHAQAWIEFQIQANLANTIILNDIVVEDVFTSGDLTIENVKGKAEHSWDFRNYTSADFSVGATDGDRDNDTYNVFGYSGDATIKYVKVSDNDPATISDIDFVDFLLPEQDKTAFVLYYELEGNPKGAGAGLAGQQLSYRFELQHQTWLAGKKYVYQITMKTNEITINPTVCEWGPGIVTDLSGEIE